ncbi:MAG: TonB-dependent receptor [Hyphomonadaceae bacterium]|nr:TonB-dependent receptor [Hyphomonadaceae bacterium]
MNLKLTVAQALVAALPFAISAPALAQEYPNPLTTIVIIGERSDDGPGAVSVEPVREARLATLPDLFFGAPGVLAQTNFGGVDHPRLSIRGSGLQRGTQPAGRGVELRLNGLPMTYADTSFDFVEWIEPLAFDRALVLRGGRAVLADAASLGGAIDFRIQSGLESSGFLLRGETGSFEAERAQVAIGAGSDAADGFASLNWFAQEGDRQFAAQEAARALVGGRWTLSETTTLTANVLYSDSALELPGPLTLAEIEAGSQAAQTGNLLGDWRRFAERSRLAFGLDHDFGDVQFSADVSRMDTDVEFRRRDVQIEDSADWSMSAALSGELGETEWRVGYLGQRGERSVQQYLNGGGTQPTFTGARGLLWADNDLTAKRDTLSVGVESTITPRLTLQGVLAHNRHTREIEDRFPIRLERPAAEMDESYEATTGLALSTYAATDEIEVFAAASRTHEPPTWDVLLVNANGAGVGSVLVDGANPRRPVIAILDDQSADTLEFGVRGEIGPARFDVTVYRSWLEGEIVSTTDPVSQTVLSVGNADETRRFGIEAFAEVRLSETMSVAGAWTWTDARFQNDPRFGDNQLPIVPEHVVALSLDYRGARGVFAGARVEYVPEGGFADYANTLQADSYATLGARLGYESGGYSVFLEGRNLTDERYVSTVIAAQNNLAGLDNASFAPGEGAAMVFGLEASWGR